MSTDAPRRTGEWSHLDTNGTVRVSRHRREAVLMQRCLGSLHVMFLQLPSS
jgi:hypothetical protein